MREIIKHSVPKSEHALLQHALPNLDWENIRVFLAVARAQSFRTAEKNLGMSLNTIRRRIERLEQEIGSLLFTRHVTGLRLTSKGKKLYAASKQMEQASYDVLRTASSRFSEIAGTVRINVTEGIGTIWVMPRLVEFQQTFPLITTELNCTMDRADAARMETDISIQIEKPVNPTLKAIKLGRLHLIPFAAKNYLRTYGYPTSLQDWPNHKIVMQVSDQIDESIVPKLFPGMPENGFISIRTNTSTAHYWAVVKGAGIGVFPTYLWLLGANIEPLDVGFYMHRDIWLSFHPDVRKIKHISVAIDWCKKAFDPKTFPWFGDDFIHPNELGEMLNRDAFANMFDGFTSR